MIDSPHRVSIYLSPFCIFLPKLKKKIQKSASKNSVLPVLLMHKVGNKRSFTPLHAKVEKKYVMICDEIIN